MNYKEPKTSDNNIKSLGECKILTSCDSDIKY